MKIVLYCFGKVRSELIKEETRLLKLLKGTSFELKLLKEAQGDQKSKLHAEAKILEKQIPSHALRIVLDEKGKLPTSVELSDYIYEKWIHQGKELALIIGSAYGLDPLIKEQAHFKLSLSPLTLTHDHARILCLEQCYRAWAIHQNHPYHHV